MNQPTYFMAICCTTVILIKIPNTTHQTCNMTGYLGSLTNFNQARTRFCAQMGHQALTTLCISTTDRHENSSHQTLMMQAESVSRMFDNNSIFAWLSSKTSLYSHDESFKSRETYLNT